MLIESQGKLEKSRGILCQKFGRHPVTPKTFFSFRARQNSIFFVVKIFVYSKIPDIIMRQMFMFI